MTVLALVLSPSRDAFRSRMTPKQAQGQAKIVHGLLAGQGVGVFTEWKRRREVTRATFGPFTPWRTGCGNPTVQVGGRSKTWGFTLGHRLWRGCVVPGGSRGRPLISRASRWVWLGCIRPLVGRGRGVVR